VSLELDAGSGVLRLEVGDDGRGMGAGRGVGLHSMCERAEELGGTLLVGPGSEGGTVVRAELPCLPERGA
jgi:signal transduction histidine kinase